MDNIISVISLNKKFKKFENGIKKLSLRILEILNKKNVAVEIYLADNQKMRFLNKKFRGKDKPTSVLSFKEPKNFPHPETKAWPLGEIYLNLDHSTMTMTMTKIKDDKCHSHCHSPYLIHGLLHLFGYNHKKKSDRMKMERIERLLIEKLNKLNPSIF